MKTISKATLAALALGLSPWIANAQDAGGPPPGQPQPPPRHWSAPPNGFRPHRPPRFVPPLVAALDANHDGVIDAQEIANASAALKKLDKNGDGKLTPDELRPPRPRGMRRPPGHRGPRDWQRRGFDRPGPGAPDGNPPPNPPSGN